MTIPLRIYSTRRVLGVGLEFLPWLGLAVGPLLLPSSVLQGTIPIPPLLLSALFLVIGGAAIHIRRRWSESPRPPSPPLHSPSDVAVDAPDREDLKLLPSHGDGASLVTDPQTLPSLSPTETDLSTSNEEAKRDGLTGLAERSALLNKIAHQLEQADLEDSGPALISITIDEYRDVTESFGHDTGQELLTTVATRIENIIPPSATAARIAEDTFSVFLPHADEDRAEEVGQCLLHELDGSFPIAGRQMPLQTSLGMALRRHDSPFSSAEDMLQASYSAMHQMRRQGGDELIVFQDEDRANTRWLHRRERLREAIRDDELTLHYQPIVHLISGEAVGAEALVRWNHPERGLLPPSAFIPLAEETGLIGELDRWVFEQALHQASTWTRSPNGPVDWISVNISPQSAEGELKSWCRDKLRGVPLPDGALHLEITERWALRDERSLRPLRDEGVRLTIDDFGTGYSSLRYLRSLDADAIKIDREFIQAIGREPKTTAIVQFLLNLALRLDVEVVAEGVETTEQEETLRELGCAMAQGFHFAEPLPADPFAEQTPLAPLQEPAGDELAQRT